MQSVGSYFRLKAQEFGLRLKQAQSVIRNHNPSVGFIGEEILRSYLAESLPGKYRVTQGFIQDGETQSHQCDIIIYDCMEFAPLYELGAIDVIAAQAVRAVIEVKSSITPPPFRKVLDAFHQLGEIGVRNKYLFCYDSTSCKTLSNYFFSHKKDADRPNKRYDTSDFIISDGNIEAYDVDCIDYLPTGIISLKKDFYLRLGQVQNEENDYVGYNRYAFSDPSGEELASLQLFLSDLFNDIGCKSDNTSLESSFSFLSLRDNIILCPQ